jgi:hypothetical protein
MMREIIKIIRKIQKRIFAIEAAPAAIPPNPKTAAIMAIMKNISAQYNIFIPGLMNPIHSKISISHAKLKKYLILNRSYLNFFSGKFL